MAQCAARDPGRGWLRVFRPCQRRADAHLRQSSGGNHCETMTGLVITKNSAIHGQGCFAGHAISAGARVIEYVGEKIDKKESLRRCQGGNEYIFALDETYDLDGFVEQNIARFINHSCAPNCEAIPDGGKIWIIALRDLAAGEELTFNYG